MAVEIISRATDFQADDEGSIPFTRSNKINRLGGQIGRHGFQKSQLGSLWEDWNMDQPPQGQRFSHVYLDRGMPTQDSPRMRRRLAALVQNIPDCDLLAPLIEQEHGIDVPWLGSRRHWERFLALCDLRDVLDLVTTAYGYIAGKQRAGVYTAKAPMAWLQGVERIFAEENVQYAVDGKGGVHFSVDKEFAHNQATTIKALQSVRYANALHALEDGWPTLERCRPTAKAR